MKGMRERNVICIDSAVPVVEVELTEPTVSALDHFWNQDWAEFKLLRRQLYLKANNLAQYRHKSEAVQEAVFNLRNKLLDVNEAQIEVDRANR